MTSSLLNREQCFIDDALKKAIAVCEKLKKSGKETKIANMAKKEMKAKKDVQNKNQTTHLSAFSLAKMGKDNSQLVDQLIKCYCNQIKL